MSSPRQAETAPLPLTLAAAGAALEGLVLVGEGVSLVLALHSDKLVMGVSSALFFVVYGAFLAFCASRLRQRRSWVRAPVVLAQLIQVMVALSFWGGSTTALAVVLLAVAAVVLVGIFHPASLEALAEPS